MIQIEHLVKHYGEQIAVDDVSFSVAAGEILGFLGPNGAGKSTTMKIITGYISATSGHVRVDGHDILEEPQEVKSLIGYLPESPPLYNEMTVQEYLDFVARLKGLTAKERRSSIDRVLEITRIQDMRKRLVGNLSKGYRQRVGLAQALLGQPKVLILDEPTSGLDPKQIIEIRNLVRDLGKDHTVILSSHILSEVQEICNRVLIINRGKLVADEIIQHEHQDFALCSELDVSVKESSKEVENFLRQVPGVRQVDLLGSQADGFSGRLYFEPGQDVRREVFLGLANRKWNVLNFTPANQGLEDIFLRVTASDYVPRASLGSTSEPELSSENESLKQAGAKVTGSIERENESANDHKSVNQEENADSTADVTNTEPKNGGQA